MQARLRRHGFSRAEESRGELPLLAERGEPAVISMKLCVPGCDPVSCSRAKTWMRSARARSGARRSIHSIARFMSAMATVSWLPICVASVSTRW
jgi:hypothetical protein